MISFVSSIGELSATSLFKVNLSPKLMVLKVPKSSGLQTYFTNLVLVSKLVSGTLRTYE